MLDSVKIIKGEQTEEWGEREEADYVCLLY
jgi:hypothetical protein